MKSLFSDKKIIILLLGILILSAVLRFAHLGTVPFVADEFLDVNATYGHFQTGQWHAWDFNHQAVSTRINPASDQRAWMYRAQVSKLYSVLPPTETTIRLTSALWGVATTLILFIVTFLFTRNIWISLIAAFLWAVSVPAIEMNRKIRMYSMFAPFFLLFSWSVFAFLENSKQHTKDLLSELFTLQWWQAPFVAVFGIVSYHLHPLTGNIAFVVLAYLIIRSVQELRPGFVVSRYLLYVLLACTVLVVARFTFPEQITWFLQTLTFFENHYSYIGHILAHFQHPLIGVVLLVLGAHALLTDADHRRAGLWIVTSFCTILLCAIFLWNRNVGPQYIFFAQTFALMIAAAGVYRIAELARQYISHPRIFTYTLLIVLIFVPQYGYFFAENNTYHISSRAETPNYRKIFDYVKRNKAEDDVMITRNFRNYYYNDQNIKVFDFGSERGAQALAAEGKVHKVTVAQVKEITAEHPSGWIVFSDNDRKFITKEAQQYFDDNFLKIKDSPLIRGNIFVYRW